MIMQLAVFTAAGILLSVIGIAGTTILDRSYRFPLDVQHRLQLPVLAVIPDIIPRQKPDPMHAVVNRPEEPPEDGGKTAVKLPLPKIKLNKQKAEKRLISNDESKLKTTVGNHPDGLTSDNDDSLTTNAEKRDNENEYIQMENE
jgi:hypothetical protein